MTDLLEASVSPPIPKFHNLPPHSRDFLSGYSSAFFLVRPRPPVRSPLPLKLTGAFYTAVYISLSGSKRASYTRAGSFSLLLYPSVSSCLAVCPRWAKLSPPSSRCHLLFWRAKRNSLPCFFEVLCSRTFFPGFLVNEANLFPNDFALRVPARIIFLLPGMSLFPYASPSPARD